MLTSKIAKFYLDNITLSIEVLDIIDLCRIVGILLDNAYEVAKDIKEKLVYIFYSRFIYRRGCLKMINLIIKKDILFSNHFFKIPIIIIKFMINYYWYFIFLYNKKEINKPSNFNIQF